MVDPEHREFDGVILAAGRSRRAGAFKPALVLAGKELLLHAVEGLAPWCRRVIVVVGPDGARARDLVAGRADVRVIVNDRRDEGMFVSVQAGVRAVDATRRGFFVQPVDCPFVPGEVLTTLREAFVAHGAACPVIPVHGGRGGHPVLVPAGLIPTILDADPTTTLRSILAQAGAVRVPVISAAVLTDLDTPEDFARLCADFEGRPQG